jgi:hypothetical protein
MQLGLFLWIGLSMKDWKGVVVNESSIPTVFGCAVELILISDEVQPLHRLSYVTDEDTH